MIAIYKQPSMSTAKLEEGIVEDIKPGCDTAVFQNTAWHTFEFQEAWFKTGPSFVGLMWLVAGNSEKRKDFISS